MIFRYDLAMQIMNQVFENDPTLLQAPVLRIIFPEEYLASVSRESKSTGVAPEWIFSVIRQESSFRYDVKSPANAVGLMQLLPTTAAELAKDHRLKDYNADSLLDPEVNIKLGSIYLARLTKTFNGNFPLALAAYNTGQGRMRRWLSSRRDLGPLENSRTSAPEVEVWIDEMPWDETSFYVKAILRNWMIYRLLNGAKLSISEPIWVDAKP
jgi:soluble lytic murein transglycosylase